MREMNRRKTGREVGNVVGSLYDIMMKERLKEHWGQVMKLNRRQKKEDIKSMKDFERLTCEKNHNEIVDFARGFKISCDPIA